KFAVRAYADALRAEEEPLGVRVTTVYPGRTDTDMQRAVVAHEGGHYAPEKYLRPESVAEAVRAAVTAGPDAHMTEVTIRPRPHRYTGYDPPACLSCARTASEHRSPDP